MFGNKKLIKDNRGQALVTVAILMSLFIGFTALVTDVGYLFLQKRHVQNTADAAALAGARALIDGDESNDEIIYQFVKEYVENNGLDEDSILNQEEIKAIRRSNGDNQVPVSLRNDHELFFAKVLGINQAGVAARAVAQMGTIVGMRGLIPIGVPESVMGDGIGQSIDIIEFQMSFGPGNWGWISFEGTGNQFNPNTVANLLLEPYGGIVSIGDEVQTNTGTANTSIEESIDILITTGDPVYVPIIKEATGTGTSAFEVVGFAQITITAETGNPAFWTITARVEKNSVGVGEIDSDQDASEHSVYGIRLIE